METQDHPIDGRDRRCLDDVLYSRLRNLSEKALKATTNLMLYQKAQGRRK
jgi:hypothetical protein